MNRLILTLLAGAVLGHIAEALFGQALPKAPPSVRSAAATLGIAEKPAATPGNYSFTGPLSTRSRPRRAGSTMKRCGRS